MKTKSIKYFWRSSVSVGLVVFLVIEIIAIHHHQNDLGVVLLAMGGSVLIYNGLFYVLCRYFIPSLEELVIKEEAKSAGNRMIYTTHYVRTGDEEVDKYLEPYFFARKHSQIYIAGLAVAALIGFFFFVA